MDIVLDWDASTAHMPAGMKSDIELAASYLDQWITNPIDVNIHVGFKECNATPVTTKMYEKAEFAYATESYSIVKTLLEDAGVPASSLPNLPATTNIDVSGAELKAFGLLPANGSETDGYIGFNLSNWAYSPRAQAGNDDFVAVAESCLMGALGHQVAPNTQAPDGNYSIADLYRYTADGVVATPTNVQTEQVYYSQNLGVTNLGDLSNNGGNTNGTAWQNLPTDAFQYLLGIDEDLLLTVGALDIDYVADLGFTLGPIPTGMNG